ncbi:MAG: peptidoglycan DD-metalloendopeptidase family protein [Proteobacteria bacterium]|nr:peptidoglycan DD-metalloendopeptidase family protein [Pseudomonadota bacterium]HQR04219.1 peptidoglycan DD-metalloendopeptidase family protein [Rhodocyclaceae bacterium]
MAAQLRENDKLVAAANRRLADLARQRALAESALDTLNTQSARTAGRIEARQKQLAAQLYREYVHGEPDTLGDVLRGEDPGQSTRDRYYLALVSQAQTRALGDLKQDLQEKQRLATAAAEKRGELGRIEQDQAAGRAALLARQHERQELLAHIGQRIQTQKKEIETLKASEQRLTRLIENLARQKPHSAPSPRPGRKPGAGTEPGVPPPPPLRSADISTARGAFAAQKGRLRLPVQGEIAGRFGSPRGEGSVWKGLFIRAAEGVEVHAVAAGRVAFADNLRGFGNLIIIDHGDGFLSVYGNNRNLLRTTGQEVKAGEPVAAVGASGGAGESGLYFELRYQGQPFDPLKWMAPR